MVAQYKQIKRVTHIKMSRCYPRVCGMVMRHPYIDAFSMSAILWNLIPEAAIGENASSITKV